MEEKGEGEEAGEHYGVGGPVAMLIHFTPPPGTP